MAVVLFWVGCVTTTLLVVAAIIPLIPVGNWAVRLFDFPRLQLAVLGLVPLISIAAHARLASWGWESAVLLVASLLAVAWQSSHVLPYTYVWGKEVPDAKSDKNSNLDREVRIVIANLDFNNSRHDEVFRAISATSPDLLLLIEVDRAWHDALKSLKGELCHSCGVVRGEGLGIVLWSKLPLVKKEVRYLVSERRASVFADVELPTGNIIHFVGVHPTPPGLQDSTGDSRRDSRVRDAELVLVAKAIRENQEANWIVTGDFNDVAWSHTTRLFQRLSGLKDPRVGRTLLNTYHSEHPLLRYPIDHVFVSPNFEIRKLSRFHLSGSDHFGIVAEVTAPQVDDVDPAATSGDKEEAAEIVRQGHEDAEERDVASTAKPE